MSTVRTKAIVLRRTNFGEADRIIQCITPSGKVSALARGVRRDQQASVAGREYSVFLSRVLPDFAGHPLAS